jgi:hypothetical protein
MDHMRAPCSLQQGVDVHGHDIGEIRGAALPFRDHRVGRIGLLARGHLPEVVQELVHKPRVVRQRSDGQHILGTHALVKSAAPAECRDARPGAQPGTGEEHYPHGVASLRLIC